MKIKAVSGIMLTLLLISMLTLAFNIQPVKAEDLIFSDDFDDGDISDWTVGGYLGQQWTTMPIVGVAGHPAVPGCLIVPNRGDHCGMHRSLDMTAVTFRVEFAALAVKFDGISSMGVTLYSDYTLGSENGYMFRIGYLSGPPPNINVFIGKITDGVVETLVATHYGNLANDAGPWSFERNADGGWSIHSEPPFPYWSYEGGISDLEYTTFSTIDVFIFDNTQWMTPAPFYYMNVWTYAAPPPISVTIDIDPDTLNLRSQGQWITAYIQLPEAYNPEDIDANTILLNETIQPVLDPKYDFVTNSSEYLVDHNEDGILERMVKFDRAEVMALLSVGEVTLTITGEVNGTPFEGSDTIRVR